ERSRARRAAGDRRGDRSAAAASGARFVTAALLALNARTFRSLRVHYSYRLFFTGQIVSLCGTWMQNIALPYFVWNLTHSPLAVGFLAFCRFIPFTVLGLSAGVVADRLDVRRLVICTQTAS